jgi:hypothetical protein
MKKLFVSLFAGIITLTTVQNIKADLIADWTFQTSASTNNIIGAGLTPSATQSGVLADIGTGTANASHASAASAWSIPSGNGSLNSWSANTWAVNDYFQFNLSTAGYTGISVSFDQYRSSTGPTNWTFQYSIDGSSFTTFSGYSITNSPSISPVTYNPAFTYSFDLSAISALDNNSTVAFRLVAASAPSGAPGTSRVDNFSVSSVPEPSTLALAAFGGLAALIAFRKRN